MEKGWVKVFGSMDVNYVNILRAKLEENGVGALVLNQQDSLYPSVGEAEIYVLQSNVIRAKHLINEQAI